MNAINYPEGLNSNIISELQNFNSPGIKKRLARELCDLQNENAYIHVECNEDRNISSSLHNNGHIFNINIVLAGTDDIITFEISCDYPFKPPKNIKINNIEYSSFLKINSDNTMKQMKELYSKVYKTNLPHCCLYCSSISCPANWSPAIRLLNVVQEVLTLKKIRRSIINKLLASKIINRYLIDDKGFHEYFYSFLFHF